MELSQSQRQETKLILTNTMRQSLAILRMPLPDLQQYLEKAAVENPLLEIEETDYNADRESVQVRSNGRDEERGYNWQGENQELALENLGACSEETFVEMLLEQLLRVKGEQAYLLPLCSYLIYCLDEKGYLRFDLQELAGEQKVTTAKMEAALSLIQSLQPAGVGARNLQECLLLQLKRNNPNKEAMLLVTHGLALLEKHDYKGMEKLLECNRKQLEYVIGLITRLNPIPSQGYKTDSFTDYQVPEAELKVENGEIVIEINEHFLPKLRLNKIVEDLLRASQNKGNLVYLKKEMEEAKELLSSLQNRESTIQKLLTSLVKKQAGFFLRREPLALVTTSQLAEEMGVSISTVSRAVQGKTIVFQGQSLALKNLFSQGMVGEEGAVSADMVQRKLKELVAKEDKAHPLSDDVLSKQLSALGLNISRRTVAKYRDILHIASSSKRKK